MDHRDEKLRKLTPSMCLEDSESVLILLEEWLGMEKSTQQKSAGGWEPMWGNTGLFNGCLQQGDCGPSTCSQSCAGAGSEYLNKCSRLYVNELLTQTDFEGNIRGACKDYEDGGCGWCDRFRSDGNGGSNCDMCTCPASSHAIIQDPLTYIHDKLNN